LKSQWWGKPQVQEDNHQEKGPDIKLN
jgi:hypothetical protein